MAFFYKINSDITITETAESQGAGYAIGGYSASASASNSINGIDFNTQTTYTPAIFITNRRTHSTGMSNSSIGMIAGGYNIDAVAYATDIDGISFSTETSIAITNVLGNANNSSGTNGLNTQTNGYICGGSVDTTGVQSSVKINFSTYSSLVYASAYAISKFVGAVSSSSNGYLGGGGDVGATNNTIRQYAFSTDSVSIFGSSIGNARNSVASSDNAIKGYFMSGITGGVPISDIRVVDMIVATAYTSIAVLSTPMGGAAGASSTTRGYAMGGSNRETGSQSSVFSTAIRGISFRTESAFSVASTLSIARAQGAGVYNRQYHNMYGRSFIAGGNIATGSQTNMIECIDFTATISTKINSVTLISTRTGTRGISSAKTGFFCGGSTDGSNGVTTIDGIQFSTEAYKAVGSSLGMGRLAGATFESYARGYIWGGKVTTYGTATTDSFIFETETRQQLSVSYGNPVKYAAGFAAKGDSYGWILGGENDSALATSTVYSLNLATEAAQTSGTSLPAIRYSGTAIGSSTYANAYYCGGWGGSFTVSDIYTFNHASTSGSVTFGSASAAVMSSRYDAAGSSDTHYGYLSGGFNNSTRFSSIEKISFAGSGNLEYTSLALSVPRTNAGSVAAITLHQNYNLAGFIVGGIVDSSNGLLTSIESYDFASEAAKEESNVMYEPSVNQGAASSVTKGYIAGGDTNTATTFAKVDGFVYSTRTYGTTAAVLSQARANNDGVNSSTRGYFGGGRSNSGATVYQRLDRIQFSTEAATDLGSVLATRYGSAGVNSNTVGYWAGGYSGAAYLTSVNSITFSTEAVINTGSVLGGGRVNMGGTNSTTRAYWYGGQNGTSVFGTIYRMSFPTISTTTLAATLSTSRQGCKCFGNEVAGYIAGGTNLGYTTSYNRIDKFTYSSETIAIRDAVLYIARSRAASLTAI